MAAAKRTGQVARTHRGAPIRVLIVDDHPMWRETLRSVIEHSGLGAVVGQAADGAEAVELARAHVPDVVIMDMDLPVLHGLESTRQIVACHAEAKVLVLSSSDAKDQVLSAIRAGATGYLLKTVSPSELAEAVRRVALGELTLPPGLSDMVLRELRTPSPQPAAGADVIGVAVAGNVVLHREGLAKLIVAAGFRLAGAPTCVDDLLRTLDAECTDVVILDAAQSSRERHNALDAVRELHSAHPVLGILVLSDKLLPDQVGPLLQEFPERFGYLLADRVQDLDHLADAVRRVAAGELVVDPTVVTALLVPTRGHGPGRQRMDELTPRERDVLTLMAQGRSNAAIAGQLFLGAKTVEAHVANLFMKLGLETARDDNRRVLAVVAFLRPDD